MSKKPCPQVQKSLVQYRKLKSRLENYFFFKVPLKISNTQFMQSYTDVYNLINNSELKLKNEKTYEIFENTYSRIFQQDLTSFAQTVKANLLECQVMSAEDHLSSYYRQIVKYTRFLHYTFRSLMTVEKNSKQYSKTSLFHQGLIILKNSIIQPLYNALFKLFVQNLELYQAGRLKVYNQLQYLIQLVGACGYTKYKSIKLESNYYSEFQFVSVSRETQQKGQIEYETDFFKKNFTNKMVEYLEKKYKRIADEMIKLSTPEYVQKTLSLLEKEQETSQYFYPNNSVKNLLIRSIMQIIINQKCEELIKKPKTGLGSMIDSGNIEGLKNLYKLLKKTNHQKIFAKYYQQYIQSKINSDIISKMSQQEERMAKKERVFEIVDYLYNFYTKIDRISAQIIQAQKESTDLILSTYQANGFQTACNKSNLICNFLVYYADYLLKKNDTSSESNLPELITKINKITKFLYSMDAFLRFYQKLLGVRMLYDNFKNKEIQYQIITMLKNEVGVSSMNKITSMVQDYKFSENFNLEKVPSFRNKLKFNFQVMILTAGCWQIQDLQHGKNRVPTQLLPAVEHCETQYSSNLPGRLVTWIFNYGRAILEVQFDNNVKKILIVNNYQLLILLCFQRHKFQPLKISELVSEIKPEDEPAFFASINSLVKTNVFLRENKGDKISKEEKLYFNRTFTSPSQKIFCFIVPKFNDKAATQKASGELDKERANLVDAAIVKLMKSKKVITYQELLNEVTEVPSMTRLFKPSLTLIKQRIESCIERQFIERDMKDRNMLSYKP